MNPKASVIVLNWNGWQHAIRCLATLFQSTYDNLEVVLIDNGSAPMDLQKIREWTDGRITAGEMVLLEDKGARPAKVAVYTREAALSAQEPDERIARSLIIIRSEENLGFAAGNNLGIRFVLKDPQVKYIALFNNDMEVAEDCLAQLVQEAQKDKGVGACQPKILLSREAGLIDAVGITVAFYGAATQIGYREPDKGQYNRASRVFGACAGAVLYRREMLEDIGVFDEDFFAYYEDVDLSLRARKRNWGTLFVPSAVVHHFHSASLGSNSPRKWHLCLRNEVFFVVKNLSILSMLVFFLFYYPLMILVTLYRTRKSKESVQCVFRGVKEGLLGIPNCLKKRSGIIKPLLLETSPKVTGL